jgi:AraC family transcriptional regulator of arabinose operon
MCFLIYPNEITYYQADKENPWHYMWIGFHGAKASELLKQCGFSSSNPCLKYELKSEYSLSNHISQMMNSRASEDSSVIWQTGQLYILLSHLLKNNELSQDKQRTKTIKEKYVDKAAQFMLNNYSHDINITSVAAYVKLDRSYFYSIFKGEMQMSPKEFLTQIRIKKAQELMKTTELSLREIAFSVGYTDAFLFSKVIKAHTGLSPSQYRKKLLS